MSPINNYTPTDKHSQKVKIIGIATILLSLAACTKVQSPTQLNTNEKPLKVAIPEHEFPEKSQLSTKIQNLNFTVPSKYQGKTVYQVEPSNKEKVIALTIDDSPWPKTTLEMLDICKQNNVKVTFFWVGTALQANPEIAKRVVAEGHAIGNHTWHHWY